MKKWLIFLAIFPSLGLCTEPDACSLGAQELTRVIGISSVELEAADQSDISWVRPLSDESISGVLAADEVDAVKESLKKAGFEEILGFLRRPKRGVRFSQHPAAIWFRIFGMSVEDAHSLGLMRFIIPQGEKPVFVPFAADGQHPSKTVMDQVTRLGLSSSLESVPFSKTQAGSLRGWETKSTYSNQYDMLAFFALTLQIAKESSEELFSKMAEVVFSKILDSQFPAWWSADTRNALSRFSSEEVRSFMSYLRTIRPRAVVKKPLPPMVFQLSHHLIKVTPYANIPVTLTDLGMQYDHSEREPSFFVDERGDVHQLEASERGASIEYHLSHFESFPNVSLAGAVARINALGRLLQSMNASASE